MGISMGFHISFYLKLFLIVTYIIYLCLIAFTFIKISCRINNVLTKNNLICILNGTYNPFIVIDGIKSFIALFILTLVPLLHLSGYFFVFVILTEYTESKLLTVIINKEVDEFKELVKKLKVTTLYIVFLKNNYYKGFDSKVNAICNYFTHDFAKNNLFIFYKFLALKDSFSTFSKNLYEDSDSIEKVNLLAYYKEPIIILEKEINLTYNLIKNYERHFA